MRFWLAVGALVVCGCEEEEPKPFPFSQGSAGSGSAAAPDPSTSGWTWSECGALAGLPVAAHSAQFALDGEALVVTYADRSLLLHRVGQVGSALLARAGEAVAPQVSPDGRFVIDGVNGQLVIQSLTDFLDRRELALGVAQCGAVFSLNHDNSQVLFEGSPAACVFDVETQDLVARLPTDATHVSFVNDHFVVPQAGFAFASHDSAGELVATVTLDVPEGSLFLKLTSDGLVVVERPDHSYAIYEAETGLLRAELAASLVPRPPIFSPDGALMLLPEGVVQLADGELVLAADPSLERGGLVALSLDGKRVALLDGLEREKRTALLDVESGVGIQAFGGHGRAVLDLAVSPDGTTLVSTSGEQTIGYVIEDDFSETRARWLADADVWVGTEFSPDGSLIAISGDGRALLDGATGTRLFYPPPSPNVIEGCSNAYFSFSRDQRWLAGGGFDFGVDVFDVTDRSLITTLASASCNSSVAFSPDGSLLATSVPELYRTDDWSRVWPETVTPTSAASFLTDVVFKPDASELLVTSCNLDASNNALACTSGWHSVRTGMPTNNSPQPAGNRASFSSDGSWMLIGGSLSHRATGVVRALGPGWTASAFAPNGDVIGGDRSGKITRFCKAEDN